MNQSAPEGSVIITPAEVYSKVVALTEVVTKMVATDAADATTRKNLEHRLGKVEDDVAAIKQRLWFVAGLASAAGGGIGSTLAAVFAQR
jgi:hypothetical protein